MKTKKEFKCMVVHPRATDLNSWLACESTSTPITSHARLAIATGHMEAFLNPRMATESSSARPCSMAAFSVHSRTRASLYSRLTCVQRMTATESRTDIAGPSLTVAMGTGEEPKTLTDSRTTGGNQKHRKKNPEIW